MQSLRVLPCVLMMLVVTSAFGQSEYRNAATHYQRAIDHFDRLSEQEWLLLSTYDTSSGPPTQAVRDALRKAQPILKHFQEASRQPYADHQLDYSLGFELLLPQLGEMRKMAQLSRAEALVRLHDGEPAMASMQLMNMYRSVQHFGDDGLIISSLVGQAVFALTDEVTQAAVDMGALDAWHANRLLHVLDGLAAQPDPFQTIEAIIGEREIAIAMAESFLDADQEYLQYAFGDFLSEESIEQWLNIGEEELSQHLQAYEQFVDGVAVAFMLDDPDEARAEVARLEEEFLGSDFNIMAPLTAAYGKVLERKIATEAMLAKRREALQELVIGNVEPEEVANAAVWYMRAIAQLHALDDELLTQLRDSQLRWASPLPEELASLIEQHENISELLSAGSSLRRCDFSYLRTRRDQPFLTTYAPGMHDVLRWLAADAVRLAQTDAHDEAAKRMAIAFRVIGHLSGDDHLFSAVVSHSAFLYLHNLSLSAHVGEVLNEQQLKTIALGFDRIAQADPFGYNRSIAAARTWISQQMFSRQPASDNHAEMLERVRALAKERDADELSAMLLVSELYDRPAALEQYDETRLQPLKQLLDEDAWDTLVTQVEHAVAGLRESHLEVLERSRFVAVADLAKRMSDARADLRRGVTLFQVTIVRDEPNAPETTEAQAASPAAP